MFITELIKDGEATLNQLPEKVAATTKTSVLWGLFSRVTDTRIKNEDMSAQREYYSTLVTERQERLQHEAECAGKSEEAHDLLAMRLSGLQAELEVAMTELSLAIDDLKKNLPALDKDILDAKNRIMARRADVAEAMSNFGVPGSVLLDALVAFRQLIHVGHQGATIYMPIAALLSDVIAQVRPAVQMLSTGSKSQVILAGSELLKSVGFLLQLSNMLKHTLTASWNRNLHRTEISKQLTAMDLKALDYHAKDGTKN